MVYVRLFLTLSLKINSIVVDDGIATVYFNPPENNGGAEITRYTVYATPGDISATGTASPITVGGLTNGVQYTFKVVATNTIGNSKLSDALILGIPLGLPPVPRIRLNIVSNTTAFINIETPENNSGAPITRYNFNFKKSDYK